MPVITGYTAERMKQIEDETVIGGNIVGNDLLLARRDGQSVNAGRVTGATGPTGPQGPPGVDADFGGYAEPLTDFGNVSGTVTLDFAVRNVWKVNPTGAITIAFTNLPAAGFSAPGTLWVANASHAITWPSGMQFPNGEPPTLEGVTFLSLFVTSTVQVVGAAWTMVGV